MKTPVSCLVFLLVSLWAACGQTQFGSVEKNVATALAKPFEIRVQVKFPDEQKDPVITGAIYAKLRALPNIVLVNEKPTLLLILMGQYVGKAYTCSYTLLQPANELLADAVGARVMIRMQSQGSKDGHLAATLMTTERDFIGPVYSIQDYGMVSNGRAEDVLDSIFKAIDARIFEPLRQNDLQARDEMRSLIHP